MESKTPDGLTLLKTLIDLLADQEGVTIKCEVTSEKRTCKKEEV